MRNVDRLFIEQSYECVINDLEAEESTLILMKSEGGSWRELHGRLLRLGQKYGQQERNDGVVHLQNDLLVSGDALGDKEEVPLEFKGDGC